MVAPPTPRVMVARPAGLLLPLMVAVMVLVAPVLARWPVLPMLPMLPMLPVP